jgi:hypothetical protein
MSPNPFKSGPKEEYRKSMRRRYKQSLMSSGMTEEAAESVIQTENTDENIAEDADKYRENLKEAYTSNSDSE